MLSLKTIIFLGLILLGFFATAQTDKKIVVAFEQTTIIEALSELKELTDYTFAYGNELNLSCSFFLKKQELSVKQLFDKLFSPCKIHWEIVGNTVILTRQPFPFKNYTIKGKIVDSTLALLPFVNVITSDNQITASDINGQFELKNISPINFKLVCSFIGYKTDTFSIIFGNDSIVHPTFQLTLSTIQLQEAIIESDKIVKLTSVSSMTLKNSDLQTELNMSNDPINSINQYPAIATKGDLNNSQEISIRGGDPSENKILMDNITLFYPFYSAENSIFNPDIIEKAEILTGGYQSTYGGAMSGIINLTTKKGDLTHYKGSIGVNLFRTNLLLEGPIKKDTASFIIAARGLNIPLFLDKSIYPKLINADIFTKVFWKLNDNHQLSFSTLNVIDDFSFFGQYAGTDSVEYPFVFKDRVATYSLQLQSIFSATTYNKISTNFSTQKAVLNEIKSDYPEEFSFNNYAFFFRDDLTWYLNDKVKIKSGIETTYSLFKGSANSLYRATDIDVSDTTILYKGENNNDITKNVAVYSNVQHSLTNRVMYNVGVRLIYQFNLNITNVSPRFNLNYSLTKKLDLKFATGIFYQAPLISEWKNNSQLKSNKSIHYIVGIAYKLNAYQALGAEIYYKDYKSIIIFDSNRNFSNDGRGNAKGIEFSHQYAKQVVTTRLNYSYSLADRRRNLQPKIFPFYFNQKHRVNFSLDFHPKNRIKKWLPSSYVTQFKFYTGTLYTPVEGVDTSSITNNVIYGEINSVSNPNYHNLNLKLIWKYKIGKKKQTDLSFFIEFWNLYNQKNIRERNYVINNSSSKAVQKRNRFVDPLLPNLGLKITFN